MNNLSFYDILDGLKSGKYSPKYIIELLNNNELEELDSDDIDEIALSFDNDEDKIAILKYTFRQIKIIRTLKSEESIAKAIGELDSDELKVEVASKFLRDEENILRAIETIEDSKQAMPLTLLLSRDNLKKIYFNEKNKKYDEIGLDKNITVGIEIESLGNQSNEILEKGEINGTVQHSDKNLQCGKILKRRKWR